MKPAEEYILTRPEPFKSILLHLQIVIETNFPEVELKFKWKIPVYYLNGHQLCYINASLKKGFVDVGFWAKNILEEYSDVMVSEGRTVVKSLRYTSIEDVDNELLLKVLKEVSLHSHKGFYKR
ncbi:2-dehydro-3-deoxyphosphooctonate aldolase [Tenacibaculum todarodis]|uniref:2-dehydro-3-deoxyphosphooctonate aldolase n=1 Tax=Tenacibaculum todarodis TaxID=1850252 RepID=A0A1L3JFM4_9FLAO|nr:DUF1801 domain-containing protein [Tenacibaculum todarodis]APG63863.1 2-dehydro-3-deoxyphosphooctonate aldolase [Tenacibaculum todarodis]APG66336.1 2-dehydro-3-deoxyphosphooctonate aldolase [Tenacibaculum todarodis]